MLSGTPKILEFLNKKTKEYNIRDLFFFEITSFSAILDIPLSHKLINIVVTEYNWKN